MRLNLHGDGLVAERYRRFGRCSRFRPIGDTRALGARDAASTAVRHAALDRVGSEFRVDRPRLSESGPAPRRQPVVVLRGRVPERSDRHFFPFDPGAVAYYTVPNGAVPYGFANGLCDNTIWFTDTGGNSGAQGGFIRRIQLYTPAGRNCLFSISGNAQSQ